MAVNSKKPQRPATPYTLFALILFPAIAASTCTFALRSLSEHSRPAVYRTTGLPNQPTLFLACRKIRACGIARQCSQHGHLHLTVRAVSARGPLPVHGRLHRARQRRVYMHSARLQILFAAQHHPQTSTASTTHRTSSFMISQPCASHS